MQIYFSIKAKINQEREKMIRKVNVNLCRKCIFRARKSAFQVHHCDYASIEKECRKDPPGMCSKYREDKKRTGRNSDGDTETKEEELQRL